MRLGELRKVVPERTTIWVEEAETGNHLTANENKFLNDEFDNSEVVSLFPERYRAISATGITVKVKLEGSK